MARVDVPEKVGLASRVGYPPGLKNVGGIGRG